NGCSDVNSCQLIFCSFFFFQAEDGIRDPLVTGVQTCALPIWGQNAATRRTRGGREYDVLQRSAPEAFYVDDYPGVGYIFAVAARSEERRVGKECRARGWSGPKKERVVQ